MYHVLATRLAIAAGDRVPGPVLRMDDANTAQLDVTVFTGGTLTAYLMVGNDGENFTELHSKSGVAVGGRLIPDPATDTPAVWNDIATTYIRFDWAATTSTVILGAGANLSKQ